MLFINYFKLIIIIFSVFMSKASTLSAQENEFINSLSSPQIHPLPITLKELNDEISLDSYLEKVKSNSIGYLVWSRLPVKIYIDEENHTNNYRISIEQLRVNQWISTVKKAIFEWSAYLPIVEISNIELAEIVISRAEPPLNTENNSSNKNITTIKAKTAQTSYKFHICNNILLHQMMIHISSNLGEISTLSAARHEIGHGIGIWGHSTDEKDALYYSSNKFLAPISLKDINTLRQVYKRPTRIGWKVFNSE